MGLITTLGLIGSIAYSTFVVKNDIQANKIDKVTKASYVGTINNKNTINKHFTDILRRCKIKYDKQTGNPTENKPNIAIAYLKSQGYKQQDIKYFEEIFNKKIIQQEQLKTKELQNEHQQIIKDTNQEQLKYYTFKTVNYTNFDIQKRMEILMKNKMWNKLVDNYTYIEEPFYTTEIWNLKIPTSMTRKQIQNIYNEVCWLEKVSNGVI